MDPEGRGGWSRIMVVSSRGGVGRGSRGEVGGCCLHVLHLKSAHRQKSSDLSFMIRSTRTVAPQANEPKRLKSKIN